MHILICNERLIFRFGVDRVLIILGKGLMELGHTVSVIANKFDDEVTRSFTHKAIKVPESSDYLNSNEFTAAWLEKEWDNYFSSNVPDIVLIGGWPFFSSIPFFKKKGCSVVFNDYGAVPIEGFSGGALIVQKKLRDLRKKYLLDSSLIIGISNFIVESQSIPDTRRLIPVKKILLGADHMEMGIWQSKNLKRRKTESSIDILNPLKAENKKILLCLGRWEPESYKNSEVSFDIMRKLKFHFSEVALLVLAESSCVDVPSDLQNSVFPIGFPDDEELQYIMKNCDLGISTSLWEGFNLPLAEMQWLGLPVLIFNIGAHPEVVIHPWYLCDDQEEMVQKANSILKGIDLEPNIKENALNDFHEYFTWNRVVQEYNEILEQFLHENVSEKSLSLVIDVTNAAKDPANSGVIRVTRRLSREFQKYLNPQFVIWDQQHRCYVFPTEEEFQQLGQFNGPLLLDENRISPKESRIKLDDYLSANEENCHKWLLFTETLSESYGKLVRRYAREQGINLAAIFYDAIPVHFPDFCKDSIIKANHVDYMKGLSECDVIVPISHFSSSCLEEFWREQEISGCVLSPNLLPGEFGGSERIKGIKETTSNKVNILCVSTLEPRKNHKKLIQACLLLQDKHPELEWTLTLVGNRYAGAFDIAEYVQNISKGNSHIKWLGVVDDATLHHLYCEATFTVYPSITEGFGMPILESIWHGKPCICYCEGVMSELADEGGCLTTDVLDEKRLSDAIYRLATDGQLLFNLSQEAVNRRIKTWEEYTQYFISILKSSDKQQKYLWKGLNLKKDTYSSWEEVLYPNCLCNNWQMNHSERLSVAAILSRVNPSCSIEVGTFKGGSLSLISQYSKLVFSIDIDPTIPDKFSQFENVSFLTGSSVVILPLLLQELDEEGISVEFILIDGDHSEEGVKRDINSLMGYIPKKPLFVVLHDSFNPACRKGMLEADWEKSPYVHWVDIDFVPGRLVEDGGTAHGEMWGGLALAYLHPETRQGNLIINKTANEMYETIKNS